MEPLDIPQLLEKTRDFPPKLRPLMAVFGTLQGALSLLFGEEVTVRLVSQEASKDVGVTPSPYGEVTREVELVAGDRVVATATSHIRCTAMVQAFLQDILEGKMGIGQLLTKHGLNCQAALLDCGQGDKGIFWRIYQLQGPGVSISIREYFAREMYV